MADCPTGLLVDFTIDEEIKCAETDGSSAFEEFICSLGATYRVPTISRVLDRGAALINAEMIKSPAFTEDDFITNETFDFNLPSLGDIDSPRVLKNSGKHLLKNETSLEAVCPFPLLSANYSPPKPAWTSEVEQEAKKMLKRLSLQPSSTRSEGLLGHQSSESSDFSSVSSVPGNRTVVLLSSAKSSDLDSSSMDSEFESPVFYSPARKNQKKQNIRDKENNPKMANQSPTFEANPNPEEALTPAGVKKIRGPIARRGTFTLERNPNPRNLFLSAKKMTPPSNAARRNSIVKPGTPQILCKSFAASSLNNSSVKMPCAGTPKALPKVLSFANTPQAKARISTFRKDATPKRLSNPMDARSNNTLPSSLSACKSLPLQRKGSTERVCVDNKILEVSRTNGTAPLLRKALVPNLAPKGSSAGFVAGQLATSRGPLKATATGTLGSQSLLKAPTANTTLVRARTSLTVSSASLDGTRRAVADNKSVRKLITPNLNASQHLKVRPSGISTPSRLVAKATKF